MAHGVRLSLGQRRNRAGAWGWCALALLALLAPALAIGVGAQPLIDWQPGRTGGEPWRLWSAAWVHFSAAHLAVNAVGALVVAALGVAADLPLRATVSWALAWPLTHGLLALRPELAVYGGLSGVLHAGVAVAAIWLVRTAMGRPRVIGAALLAGLIAKVVLETPWRVELPSSAALGIITVPFAHAAGALAGTLAALLLARRT